MARHISRGVLYDTDFLIALFVANQSTHEHAKAIFERIEMQQAFILHVVKYELATVLSYKFSQSFAIAIMKQLQQMPLYTLSFENTDEDDVWKKFFLQTKKGTSFVDCANWVMAEKVGLQIASFDTFYPSKIRVEL